SVMLEELNRALVTLGLGSRGKRPEVATLACPRILLAGREPVLSGRELADHGSTPPFASPTPSERRPAGRPGPWSRPPCGQRPFARRGRADEPPDGSAAPAPCARPSDEARASRHARSRASGSGKACDRGGPRARPRRRSFASWPSQSSVAP